MATIDANVRKGLYQVLIVDGTTTTDLGYVADLSLTTDQETVEFEAYNGTIQGCYKPAKLEGSLTLIQTSCAELEALGIVGTDVDETDAGVDVMTIGGPASCSDATPKKIVFHPDCKDITDVSGNITIPKATFAFNGDFSFDDCVFKIPVKFVALDHTMPSGNVVKAYIGC